MENKRFSDITVMNALLCLFVIMIHLSANPYVFLRHGSLPHTLIFIVNRALLFAVPAFIFLCGFKLYNKYGDGKMNVLGFCLGRARKILLPYVAASLVYFAYLSIKGWTTLSALPKNLLLGTTASHFYYVIIAVQFYITFPFIRKVFSKFPKTFLVVSFVCSAFLENIWYFEYSDRIIFTYLFYFVLGMAASKYKLYKHAKKLLWITFPALAVTLTVHLRLLYLGLLGDIGYTLSGEVNCVYVSLAILFLYALSSSYLEKSTLVCRMAEAVERVSYNVYLYHLLLIFLLEYDIFPHFLLTVGDRFIISTVAIFGAVIAYIFLHCFIAKRIKNEKNKNRT